METCWNLGPAALRELGELSEACGGPLRDLFWGLEGTFYVANLLDFDPVGAPPLQIVRECPVGVPEADRNKFWRKHCCGNLNPGEVVEAIEHRLQDNTGWLFARIDRGWVTVQSVSKNQQRRSHLTRRDISVDLCCALGLESSQQLVQLLPGGCLRTPALGMEISLAAFDAAMQRYTASDGALLDLTNTGYTGLTLHAGVAELAAICWSKEPGQARDAEKRKEVVAFHNTHSCVLGDDTLAKTKAALQSPCPRRLSVQRSEYRLSDYATLHVKKAAEITPELIKQMVSVAPPIF